MPEIPPPGNQFLFPAITATPAERRATPARVHRTLRRTLAPGGTVLLHDSDRAAAPGSWRTTLAALPLLSRATPAPLGSLADHGLAPAGTSRGQVADRSAWSG